MDRPPVSSLPRLYLSSWWVVCIILGAVYSGNLVAFLSVYKPPNLVDTVEELIDSNYAIGIPKGTATEESVTVSNCGIISNPHFYPILVNDIKFLWIV